MRRKKALPAPKRQIDMLIIHCTATGDYPPGHIYFDRIGVRQLREWHMRPVDQGGRNFDDVAYHYVIRRTGVLEVGRPEYMIGAHCFGHNLKSIGIAYVGTKDPTPEQLLTMRLLVGDLLQKYRIKPENVHGHKDFAAKICPGIDVKTEILDYLTEYREPP